MRAKAIVLVVAAVVVLIAVLRSMTSAPDPDLQPPPATEPSASATPADPTSSAPAPSTAVATESTSTPGPREPGDASHSHDQPYSQTAEARRLWLPVVEGFARRFTNTDGGSSSWRKRLKAYTTVSVQKDLATVEASKVPAGRYTGHEVLEAGDEQLAAKVTYAEGWAMVLYVISDGNKWRIYRYDRYEE